MSIAKRLNRIMEYYELTPSAFADQIDVQRSSISHLLSGRNKPSLDFVMKVLEQFPEVELQWLINGKGIFPVNEKFSSSKSFTPFSGNKKLEQQTIKFPEELNPIDTLNELTTNKNIIEEEIEQIVIFYKDGTFNNYSKK